MPASMTRARITAAVMFSGALRRAIVATMSAVTAITVISSCGLKRLRNIGFILAKHDLVEDEEEQAEEEADEEPICGGAVQLRLLGAAKGHVIASGCNSERLR